ncbi:ABC transporter substrate-binding protein [Bosea sp. (in: a-proteobacteria)]|jgi:iron complex transport system substrate-binding protein|uniref:ABC transporter substrate-binding protein n=1 Tax=Bosea sp. (in: a-proteobacteria) TaxID=1871050 RepID=UPI003F705EF6
MQADTARPASRWPGAFLRRLMAAMLTLAALMLACAVAPAQEATQGPIRVTDIAGREVVLPRPAQRIVLGAWVSLDALSLLHPDPVSLLAGWAEGGSNGIQPAILRDKFPAIGKVPVIGRGTLDSISVETVVAQRPDLVVLSQFDAFRYGAGAAAKPPALAQLEAAGIPVVIVDFFLDPLRNTEASLRVLGRLIGREAQAEAFLAFYREHLTAIERRLAAAKPAPTRPSVFLHAFATRPECCFSAGPGTIDGFIRLAGGHNIGVETLTGPVGQLSLEYVLARNPDIYVATGVSGGAAGGFALGPGVSPQRAAEGFATLLKRTDLAALDAVSKRRAFGLWHLFVHTPLHLVAVEALAKWLHPELFETLDPRATLDEINARFLAAPLSGTFWVGPNAAGQP